MVMKFKTQTIKTNTTIGYKERDMDDIAKAVKEALAKKGIDVQKQWNKSAKNSTRLAGVSVRPHNNNHVHKGVMHTDHNIQVPTKKVDDE